MSHIQRFRVTVANGATVANELDLTEYEPLAFAIDGTITSTTMTFLGRSRRAAQGTATAGTARAVADSSGAAVSVTVASNKYVVLTEALRNALVGVAYLTPVMGSAEGAAREFDIICVPRTS